MRRPDFDVPRAAKELAVNQMLRIVGGSKQIQIDEIDACRKLAARLFGKCDGQRHGRGWGGVVELDGSGVIHIGYYIDPPTRNAAPAPGVHTGRGIRQPRTVIVCQGRSHADLLAQARLLGIAGVL